MEINEFEIAKEDFIVKSYDYEQFRKFIEESFRHLGNGLDFIDQEIEYDEPFLSTTQVCKTIKLDSSHTLGIYAFEVDSLRAKIGLHKALAKLSKDNTLSAILAVFYTQDIRTFRFSLVTSGYDFEKNEVIFSDFRRHSFMLGDNEKVATARKQLGHLKNATKLESIQEAFALEPITDEFYKDYEDIYKKISQNLISITHIFEGYDGLSGEKAIHAFVKKLLGRIVFLYFLQKKGWLGVAKGDSWGDGKRDFINTLFTQAQEKGVSFYANYLCPLFFESLNRKRDDDYFDKFDCKIPFLNGGIFEKWEDKLKKTSEDNFLIAQILDNETFKKIFDFLNSYNFTIEESTPSNVELGIDPEMLGKVFENLIDYNKSTGAFYTPRGIVHYMCKNALICSLSTLFPHNTNEIERLIYEQESDNDFIKQNGKAIHNHLKNLKILDPSIGSGAFPMGLLSEILATLNALDKTIDQAQQAQLKREIINHTIYGIDIDADAIEIAKLRFWLSIAVDEEEPTPLPNLDFKFMQGNSLLENLNDTEILPKNLENYQVESNLFGERDIKDSLFDKSLTDRLYELFNQYYVENNSTKKRDLKANILALMGQSFKWRIQELDSIIKSEKNNPEPNPKKRAKQQERILKRMQDIAEIEQLYQDYQTNDFHTDKLFLYRLFFAEVFKCGGFDIIIGNPPYIRQEKIPNKEQIIQEFTHYSQDSTLPKWKFADKTADIFTYFFAKGLQILKPNGILSFITSNKYARAKYGKNLRSLMLQNQFISYIDFNGIKTFNNATVDTTITTLCKMKPDDTHTIIHLNLVDNLDQDNQAESIINQESKIHTLIKTQANNIKQDSLSNEGFVFPKDPSTQALKSKIESIGTPLKDWDISINYGIKTGCNEAFIIDTAKKDEILSQCDDSDERERTAQIIKPILRGRDIKRYSYEWAGLWVINTHNGYDMDSSSLRGEAEAIQNDNKKSMDCHEVVPTSRNDKTSKYRIPPINIDEYPTLKRYFDTTAQQIESNDKGKKKGKGFYNRDDKGITPYNLRNCAYIGDFARQKIVYSEIVQEPQFYLDNGDFEFGNFYAEATSFIMTGENLHYLLGVLHSKIATFAFKEFYAGGGLGSGGFRYKKAFLEKLPIPQIKGKKEEKIIKIVQEILEYKQCDKNTKKLESSLDTLIYELYGLNLDEIALVESKFKGNKAEREREREQK